MHNYQQSVYGEIPSEWRIDSLKSVCVKEDGVLTGPFGSQLHQRDYQAEGVPIITVEHLGENYLVHTDIPRVSDSDYKRLSRYSLKAGDIVFSRVGSVDRRALVREEEAGWLFSGRCLRVRPDPNVVNPDFLSWFFGLPIFKDYIRKIAVGATMPSLNTSLLRNVEVVIPPILEQNTIACILNGLASKILLNDETNKTLEAIGQAVFKRWFVDFEFPNEEGKPYKSSGGKIVNSAGRIVPSGWEVGSLGDICEIVMGQSPPSDTYNEEGKGVPFFQGIRDFGFRFASKRVYCTAPTRFAQEGDVLLSVRAPVGSLNVADEHCAIGRGVAALRLKGKQNSFLYYLLLATRSAWDMHNAEGTVFGSVTKQGVYGFKIIIPPKELREKFGELMDPLDKKILLNEKQSRNLTTMRNSLLPKLMAGKIRVSEFVENGEAP